MFILNKSFWRVKNTTNKGRGVFAKRKIEKGTVIGDYTGKLVKIEEVDFDTEKKNMYLMYYSDNLGIYPDLTKESVHLINHSCSPNCWITSYKDRTLVFVLKDIEKGEEITIDYLLPPKTNCKNCPHKCFCGSDNCRGSMHLSEKLYTKWQKFQKKNKDPNQKFTQNKSGILKPLVAYPPHISEKFIKSLKHALYLIYDKN